MGDVQGGLAEADCVAETAIAAYQLAKRDFDDLLGSYEEVWRFAALRKVRCMKCVAAAGLGRCCRILLHTVLYQVMIMYTNQ